MTVLIQFLGDISLDGLYCDPQNHEAVGANAAVVSGVLGSCDFRIANWESPLVGNGETNRLKRIRLATTWRAAKAILPLGLNAVTLANNHTFDCGSSGYRSTCRFLGTHGILYLGAGLKEEEARMPLRFERDGISFVLLNFVGEETCPHIPEGSGQFLNVLQEERVLSEVRSWKAETDHVLVGLHWGDRDVIEHPSPSMRQFGRSLAEAGASVVFGGQTHVVLGSEMWRGGVVIYSLGNYCCSPVGLSCGDAQRTPHPLTKKGAVASIRFAKNAVERVSWKYVRQSERSLFIEEDTSDRVRQRHAELSRALTLDERAFLRVYRWNTRKWSIHAHLDAHGGWWGAIAGLRWRHPLWVCRRIFGLNRQASESVGRRSSKT